MLKRREKKSLKRERNYKGMRIPFLFKELYLQPENDETVQNILCTKNCTCRKRQRTRKRTCSAEKDEKSARISAFLEDENSIEDFGSSRSRIDEPLEALRRWRRSLLQGSV